MMLKISQVEVKVEDTPEKVYSTSLAGSLDEYTRIYKANTNTKSNIKLLTYSQIHKKFIYQVPSRFEPISNISKVVGLELILKPKTDKEPEVLSTILVDATAKVLAYTNRMTTVVPAQALGYVTGGETLVAYISDLYWNEFNANKDKGNVEKLIETLDAKYRENKITFVGLKRVFDYNDELKAQQEKTAREPKVGRPKKMANKGLYVFDDTKLERSVLRVVLADGGLVVSDRLLLK